MAIWYKNWVAAERRAPEMDCVSRVPTKPWSGEGGWSQSRSARTAGTSWTRKASPSSGWARPSGSSFGSTRLEDAADDYREDRRPRVRVCASHARWASATAPQPNVHGEKPWIDDDPLTPNEGYFKHVDAVVQIARENNLVHLDDDVPSALSPRSSRMEKARAWAKWVARRYKDAPNIVWSMTPEAKSEFAPVLRELAAGLREGDGGRHLMTFKPDPAPHPAGLPSRRTVAGFQRDADLEVGRDDLPDGDGGIQSQARSSLWSWGRAPMSTAPNTASR